MTFFFLVRARAPLQITNYFMHVIARYNRINIYFMNTVKREEGNHCHRIRKKRGKFSVIFFFYLSHLFSGAALVASYHLLNLSGSQPTRRYRRAAPRHARIQGRFPSLVCLVENARAIRTSCRRGVGVRVAAGRPLSFLLQLSTRASKLRRSGRAFVDKFFSNILLYSYKINKRRTACLEFSNPRDQYDRERERERGPAAEPARRLPMS